MKTQNRRLWVCPNHLTTYIQGSQRGLSETYALITTLNLCTMAYNLLLFNNIAQATESLIIVFTASEMN
jgi:hypothetical protein